MKICYKAHKIFLNSKKQMKMMNSFYKKKQKSLAQFLKSCINKHKKRVISFFLCNSVSLKAFIDFLQNILQHITILLNNLVIKMSFANLLNFFIFIFQFILQFYYMFMFIANTIEFFMFNDKTVIDFLKWLNDLYEKHDIIENDQKIYCFSHYYNTKHADVICLFSEYVYKNWQQFYVIMKKKFYEIDSEQCHNNQAFLKKLKTAECKNMKIIKKYYYQFNVISNKLIIEKIFNSFT